MPAGRGRGPPAASPDPCSDLRQAMTASCPPAACTSAAVSMCSPLDTRRRIESEVPVPSPLIGPPVAERPTLEGVVRFTPLAVYWITTLTVLPVSPVIADCNELTAPKPGQ